MKILRGMLVQPKIGQTVISTEELYVIIDVVENDMILLKSTKYFSESGYNRMVIPKMFKFKESHFKVLGMVDLNGHS